MHIGLDFGTTNSGAAVFDGQRVRLFALDPASREAAVMRSVMYITRAQEVFVGQEAIHTYYTQNIGRPSKMVPHHVGEIEITMGVVESVKGYPGGPSTFIRDVHVLVDELMPGRMLRSLKSGLATGYEGTAIFERSYTLEDLIALYLRHVRERVEAQTGESVEGAVLGRPVHFVGSGSEQDDRRAEERLRRAAELAGFREIAFELEPVAAALHYELTVQKPQNVLVFDFGGGTLDITVMRVGGPDQRQVFATGGVGIAGDTFDQRIVSSTLLDHFGRGTTVRLSAHGEAWGNDDAPLPRQYTDALAHWQTIPELLKPEALHFLRRAQLSGSHPARIQALESLVVNNYAARLLDEVEQAKIALSSAHFALIRLAGEGIDLWQPLTRSQFETLIADAARQVETCLLETFARSGLEVREVDAVVRTGGSAQVPCFVALLERIFGPQKVVQADVFSSVTSGLAIRAAALGAR